jgi:hypothetical protein
VQARSACDGQENGKATNLMGEGLVIQCLALASSVVN